MVVSSLYGCSNTSTVTTVVLTNIGEASAITGIQISPNPAKDIIFISSKLKENKVISYSIYSLLGQEVKSGSINLNTNEAVNIADLKPAMYEIKLQNNKATSSFKFMKE